MILTITIKKIVIAALLIAVTATVASNISIGFDRDFEEYMQQRGSVSALALLK